MDDKFKLEHQHNTNFANTMDYSYKIINDLSKTVETTQVRILRLRSL